MSLQPEVWAETEDRRRGIIDACDHVMGPAGPLGVPGALLAPDFRMENRATAAADDVYWGERGLREWLEDMLAVFADGACYSVDEIIEESEEVVVATCSICGRGASSGRWIEFRWTGVTWLRDGQAVRAAGYPCRGEALEAAGVGPR